MLVLPDSERIVDATVEQFDEVREIGAGPMIGRVALSVDATQDSGLMEPGAQVVLQRGDLVPTYTVAGPEALASIVDHSEVAAHTDGHRRTEVNVASWRWLPCEVKVCVKTKQAAAPVPPVAARAQLRM
ncbi:hypothetical protein [Streptomyces sp. MBT53]|uniref:hypothetical protein n=1 Tax=Streptomyces sp. MBT53 TaxID=1488384 RepID=UPI00191454DC|nr:hypothetical protein [Streptomyces sp. MBT53]MBK6016804.1 hypothetical protein [Streptomyces sp. MBT53]